MDKTVQIRKHNNSITYCSDEEQLIGTVAGVEMLARVVETVESVVDVVDIDTVVKLEGSVFEIVDNVVVDLDEVNACVALSAINSEAILHRCPV
jgi:hypothetical protein